MYIIREKICESWWNKSTAFIIICRRIVGQDMSAAHFWSRRCEWGSVCWQAGDKGKGERPQSIASPFTAATLQSWRLCHCHWCPKLTALPLRTKHRDFPSILDVACPCMAWCYKNWKVWNLKREIKCRNCLLGLLDQCNEVPSYAGLWDDPPNSSDEILV